jgi:6-phosphogluconolactonase (cycloisomerase 2 family)
VDPSGQFLYVAMLDALNIWTYAIDTSTGALTPTGTSVFAQDPNSITMDPSGQFAYVGAFDNVFAYTMNPGTGVLTAVAGSPFAPGTEPGNFGVAVDPSGQFAYVASRWYRNLAAYTIDPSSGALTATGSSAATGGIPDTVVIIGTI